MSTPDNMPRMMAFDVGGSRIGVARLTALGVAEPVTVMEARKRPWRQIRDEIEDLSRQWDIQEFVVGLPLNLNGTSGPQANKSREFANALQNSFPRISVHLEDERMTTELAYERLNEKGVKGAKAREQVDGVAACIILENRMARIQMECREREKTERKKTERENR